MNQKLTAVLASAMTLVILLSACGAAAPSSAPAVSPRMENHAVAEDMATDQIVMNAAPMAPQSGEAAPQLTAPANRKVILHSDLMLETTEFDTALTQIAALVTEQGGYIESQNAEGRSMRSNDPYYERSASINARVPADRLAAVTAALGTHCNIISRNDSSEDITDTYFDTEAHLKTLKTREERLLEILRKAEKLEEVITLETALSEVRYEIEALTASMKRMDSAVDFSYLRLSISEVAQLRPTLAAPRTFGEKLAVSLSASGRHLINSTQGVLLVLIEILPVLLLWGAIILAIAWLVLRIKRKRTAWLTKQLRTTLGNEPPATADETPPADSDKL